MVRLRTPASADRVWGVLSDGWRYADWVVGADRIRAVDADWPQVGARLQHSVGQWPGQVHDETEVLDCDPARRLVLQARLRPFGEARVELTVDPLPEGGCEISIAEDVTSGPAALVLGPVRRFVLDVRNVEVLRRLVSAAEG